MNLYMSPTSSPGVFKKRQTETTFMMREMEKQQGGIIEGRFPEKILFYF